MKTIFKIAKLELSTLFYSPVAWLVIVVFIVQASITYTGLVETYHRVQEMGFPPELLTEKLFTARTGLFTAILGYLYLYMPLLTMGLLSREMSSGSIKLLLSSPIKITQIVFGKYLVMLIYGLILVAVVFVYTLIGIKIVNAMELKLVLSAILGTFLLISTYAAIGLFMSSLTSYQVVAAMSTLIVFAALRYVGNLWQGIDILRDLTYYLSISGRTTDMIRGLISSKDVIYFLTVIALFLSLTFLKLKFSTQSRPLVYRISAYISLPVITLAILYLTSRPSYIAYKDVTSTKRQTLSVNSQDILKKLTKPLKMTVYVNLLDADSYVGLPERRIQDVEAFEQYLRFLPELEIKYVYYYDAPPDEKFFSRYPGLTIDQIAQRVAKISKLDLDDFLTPRQIRRKIDLLPERNHIVRILEYEGKKTALRMYDDGFKYPYEQEITVALKRLIDDVPKVGVLQGHHERSIINSEKIGYQKPLNDITFRNSLINQGFEVETTFPAYPIPKDIDILVIADPRTSYTEAELDHIHQFVRRGGNLLVTAEPGRSSIIDKVLKPIGVELVPGFLLQKGDHQPELILADLANLPEKGVNPLLPKTEINQKQKSLPTTVVADQEIPSSSETKRRKNEPVAAKSSPISDSSNKRSTESKSENRLKAFKQEMNDTLAERKKLLAQQFVPSTQKSSSASGGSEPSTRLRSAEPTSKTVSVQQNSMTTKVATSKNDVREVRKKMLSNMFAPAGMAREATVNKNRIAMPGAAGLRVIPVQGFSYYPALISDPTNTWNRLKLSTADTVEVKFNPENGDSRETFPMAFAITRKTAGKEQRILITGDADFMSGSANELMIPVSNLGLIKRIFKWFSYDRYPIVIERPQPKDNRLLISDNQLTWLKWTMLGLFPGLVAFLGAAILFARSRK